MSLGLFYGQPESADTLAVSNAALVWSWRGRRQ
jgi:hypothetical protein